jgi:ceramide glucosyltransferase
MSTIYSLTPIIGLIASGLAASYSVLTLLAVVMWRLRRPASQSQPKPPVTLLKPLCGIEPALYEHLRSFCRQDYPEFQIVFGVRDPGDSALSVVQRLRLEFPTLPIDVVVEPRLHGSNYKISNLINMIEQARHDVLVMADSDVCVAPDYLSCVTAPLLSQEVGLVTCLYLDMPTPGIWSRLGAMYINEWYMPSVLLARMFGHRGYASGQTLCLRRETLEKIGGLRALANHLAEDHQLGELIRGLGLQLVLSPTEISAQHHEPSLASLMQHELRWMRTLRALRPRSFRLLFVGFSLPLAVCGFLLLSAEPALSLTAWVLLLTTLAARLGLYFAQRSQTPLPLLSDLWLVPVRDLLLCWVWAWSFLNSRITWRGDQFDVDANGIMRRSS